MHFKIKETVGEQKEEEKQKCQREIEMRRYRLVCHNNVKLDIYIVINRLVIKNEYLILYLQTMQCNEH